LGPARRGGESDRTPFEVPQLGAPTFHLLETLIFKILGRYSKFRKESLNKRDVRTEIYTSNAVCQGAFSLMIKSIAHNSWDVQ
jgi:hypothetical protein